MISVWQSQVKKGFWVQFKYYLESRTLSVIYTEEPSTRPPFLYRARVQGLSKRIWMGVLRVVLEWMSLAFYYLRLTIPPERVISFISLLESQWSMLTDSVSLVNTKFIRRKHLRWYEWRRCFFCVWLNFNQTHSLSPICYLHKITINK